MCFRVTRFCGSLQLIQNVMIPSSWNAFDWARDEQKLLDFPRSRSEWALFLEWEIILPNSCYTKDKFSRPENEIYFCRIDEFSRISSVKLSRKKLLKMGISQNLFSSTWDTLEDKGDRWSYGNSRKWGIQSCAASLQIVLIKIFCRWKTMFLEMKRFQAHDLD